jgi:hypothetical protein
MHPKHEATLTDANFAAVSGVLNPCIRIFVQLVTCRAVSSRFIGKFASLGARHIVSFCLVSRRMVAIGLLPVSCRPTPSCSRDATACCAFGNAWAYTSKVMLICAVAEPLRHDVRRWSRAITRFGHFRIREPLLK